MNTANRAPRVIALMMSNQRQLVLLRYEDGRWGIRCDGTIVGVWEPEQAPECIRAFESLCGTIRQVIDADVKTNATKTVTRHRTAKTYEFN